MENSALFEKLVYEEYQDGINLIDFKEEYKDEVEELIIPDSWNVVAIAKRSFYDASPFEDCKKLRKVSLPSTLRLISDAFCSCSSLEEVIFPENMESFGNWNFRKCESLETVSLPNTFKKVGFGNFEFSPVYLSEYTEEDEGCIYLGKYMLKCVVDGYDTLTIKDGTVLIADCACAEKSFSEVIFPESLRYIGLQAFYHCDYLDKPILPKSIISIGDRAFKTENGDLLESSFVTDGYFDTDGRLVINKELGYISDKELEEISKEFDGCLLKIDYENESSYDNSDDERCEDSHSCSGGSAYRDLNPTKNTKALLRISGKIRGVVFRVHPNSNGEPTPYGFLFDGSVSQHMTLGYSASHSSNHLTVYRVSVVKAGEDGAPSTGGYLNFNPGELSTSI
ncbi:MAG: leucine-rich repeat domain-containing protein [Clostridia bacterium]|nr:leucine-rich repeat domain-containing protein [Clostridia bacterium]